MGFLLLLLGFAIHVSAQAVEATTEDQIASANPARFPTGLVEAETGGELVRLPFDQPFTLSLALSGLELSFEKPTLRYREFEGKKAFEEALEDGSRLCTQGKSTLFGGIADFQEGAETVQKARFLVPSLAPNRYQLLCFSAVTRLSVELSAAERALLLSELEAPLAGRETELELADAEQMAAEIREILEAVVRRYATRKGLTGEVKLAQEFSTLEVLEKFRSQRDAMANCDVDWIRGEMITGDDLLLVPGPLRNRLEELLEDVYGHQTRVPAGQCLSFYRAAIDAIKGTDPTGPFDESEKATLKGRLEGPAEELATLQLAGSPLRAFSKEAIEALQSTDTIVLAASVPASSAARSYVSLDGGFAYVPELEAGVPYTGINIYLRPVNPPSVTPLGKGRDGLARRFSLMLGLTLDAGLITKETAPGGDEIVVVDDFTDFGSLLAGFGFRINPALRVGGGAVFYKQLDTLIDSSPSTEVSYFVTISLDMNVAALFTDKAGGFFNGGSPRTTQSKDQ